MKGKKQPVVQIQILRMPDPPHFSKMKLKEEKEDPVEEFRAYQLEEKLIEEVGAKLDEHFALTGEPITAALTLGHHAFEVTEMLGSSGRKTNNKTIVIQPRRQQLEDEDEIFK